MYDGGRRMTLDEKIALLIELGLITEEEE